jgi:hypothetical protein
MQVGFEVWGLGFNMFVCKAADGTRDVPVGAARGRAGQHRYGFRFCLALT